MPELVKVGDSVIYHGSKDRAALVVGVHDLPNQILTLAVFVSNDEPAHMVGAIPELQAQTARLRQQQPYALPPTIAGWHATPENHKAPLGGVAWEYAVYDEGASPEPGTWHWPQTPQHPRVTAAGPIYSNTPGAGGLDPQTAMTIANLQRQNDALATQLAAIMDTVSRMATAQGVGATAPPPDASTQTDPAPLPDTMQAALRSAGGIVPRNAPTAPVEAQETAPAPTAASTDLVP